MPQTPFWAKPKFVALAILAYLAVHFAVRMAMWPTLGIDDSEQALFSQQFAWSYRNQAPPLFTWLLIGVGRVFGVNIVAISLIRYALLAIAFGFAYATARRLIADPRFSALSLYSFAAIYVFAFYSHHDLTHTTAMAAMLSVAWYVFVRLAAEPRLGRYLALGAVFGFGFLGKWNFLMFAAALPLACLALPDYRRLVFTWKILPAVAICAVLVLPTALAALAEGATGTASGVLVGGDEPYPVRVVEGIGRLAASALLYPQPLLPLLLIVFAAPLWRGLRIPSRAETRPSLAFLVWTMAISLALHLALVLALGAREFHERLMQPPLFILPIALFMLIERGRPSKRAVDIFALMLAVLVAGTLAARITVFLLGADHCGSCRNMAPFRALAADLRDAGYSGQGTIVAGGYHIGGNMRVVFPEARIVDASAPAHIWPPPRDDGPCLLLWQERDPEKTAGDRAWVESYLAGELHGPRDARRREGVVSELMFGSDKRQYRLAFALYDGAAGDCR
jgi:hypothetical protein